MWSCFHSAMLWGVTLLHFQVPGRRWWLGWKRMPQPGKDSRKEPSSFSTKGQSLVWKNKEWHCKTRWKCFSFTVSWQYGLFQNEWRQNDSHKNEMFFIFYILNFYIKTSFCMQNDFYWQKHVEYELDFIDVVGSPFTTVKSSDLTCRSVVNHHLFSLQMNKTAGYKSSKTNEDIWMFMKNW